MSDKLNEGVDVAMGVDRDGFADAPTEANVLSVPLVVCSARYGLRWGKK